jgi:hypothetical protein
MVNFLTAIFNVIAYVRSLFNPIWSPYTKFETALLNEFKSHLSPDELVIFEHQIAEINNVQRAPQHLYINLYKLTPFSVSRARSSKFESDKEEWVLRRCKITVQDVYSVVANFWIVNGNFFSITFSQPVKKYSNISNIKLTVLEHEETGVFSREVEEMGR